MHKQKSTLLESRVPNPRGSTAFNTLRNFLKRALLQKMEFKEAEISHKICSNLGFLGMFMIVYFLVNDQLNFATWLTMDQAKELPDLQLTFEKILPPPNQRIEIIRCGENKACLRSIYVSSVTPPHHLMQERR